MKENNVKCVATASFYTPIHIIFGHYTQSCSSQHSATKEIFYVQMYSWKAQGSWSVQHSSITDYTFFFIWRLQDGMVVIAGRAEDFSIWIYFVFAGTDGREHNLLPKHVLVRLNTKPQSRWSQNNMQLKMQEVWSVFFWGFFYAYYYGFFSLSRSPPQAVTSLLLLSSSMV